MNITLNLLTTAMRYIKPRSVNGVFARSRDFENAKANIALMTALAKSALIETMRLYRQGIERELANLNECGAAIDINDFLHDIEVDSENLPHALDLAYERMVEGRVS